jgi:hypothetical protein
MDMRKSIERDIMNMRRSRKSKKPVVCTECGIMTRQKDGICVCCKLEFPYDVVLWLEECIAKGANL